MLHKIYIPTSLLILHSAITKAVCLLGDHCQTEINECESDPCHYNSSCKDGINHYTCQCIPGTTGVNCETNIDECASTPCLNDGQCIDLINAYVTLFHFLFTCYNTSLVLSSIVLNLWTGGSSTIVKSVLSTSFLFLLNNHRS